MPELPEVETIRRGLEPQLAGRTIGSIEERFAHILLRDEKAPAPPFTVERLRRRGKYLLIDLSREALLVVHLRMTGKLLVSTPDSPLAAHTHLRFHLDTEPPSSLDFSDVRRFGRVWLLPGHDETALPAIARLGPEPLSGEFTAAYLSEAAAKRTSISIKGLLLDQTVVAGIGNIYADESLFLAGIRPERRSPDLNGAEIGRLVDAVRTVLAAAIGYGGTTFRDYVDGLGRRGNFQWQLAVYGRKALPCPRCGEAVAHAKIAGRTSHFCRRCQR